LRKNSSRIRLTSRGLRFMGGQATIHFVDHSLVRVLCHRDLSHGTRVLPGPLDLPTVNRPTTNGTNTAILLVHNPLTSHLSSLSSGCQTCHHLELDQVPPYDRLWAHEHSSGQKGNRSQCQLLRGQRANLPTWQAVLLHILPKHHQSASLCFLLTVLRPQFQSCTNASGCLAVTWHLWRPGG
jgi:hypothetical protein